MREVLRGFGLALVLLAQAPGIPGQEPTSDPEILKGIAQVEDGEYDSAILTLDTAIRRLAALPEEKANLSTAYLYLGIAYFGKGHVAAAKAKFREAIIEFRELTLSAEEFPPQIVDLFETARDEAREVARERADTAEEAGEPPPTPSAPQDERGGSKALPILLGVGAAAGVGIAVAAGGGGDSTGSAGMTTPTPVPTPTPASEIVFLGSSPAPGSSVAQDGVISIQLSFLYNGEPGPTLECNPDGAPGPSGTYHWAVHSMFPQTDGGQGCWQNTQVDEFHVDLGVRYTMTVEVRQQLDQVCVREPPYTVRGLNFFLHNVSGGQCVLWGSFQDLSYEITP